MAKKDCNKVLDLEQKIERLGKEKNYNAVDLKKQDEFVTKKQDAFKSKKQKENRVGEFCEKLLLITYALEFLMALAFFIYLKVSY